MIFSLLRGDLLAQNQWETALRTHATWLGLQPVFQHRQLSESEGLSLGWLQPAGVQPHPAFNGKIGAHMVSFLRELPASSLSPILQSPHDLAKKGRELSTSLPLIWVDWQDGEITVALPPICTEQIFYAYKEDALALSNDLRLMARWAGSELDAHGVYALLEYRAIPPPYSLFQQVKRMPYGRVVRFARQPKTPQIICSLPSKVSDGQFHSEREALEGIKQALDGSLEKTPLNSLLLFSGGVDSGLLAARLSSMGRRDVRLVHLSFELHGEATEQALAMATRLGLSCQVVTYSPAYVNRTLESIARHYTFPFGDLSLTPTYMLVEDILQPNNSSGSVIEGTGGDGAFGLAGLQLEWARFYRIPIFVRQLLDKGYSSLKLWQSPSASEARLRKVHRSLNMPLAHAAILGNTTLNGIAYGIPKEIAKNLQQAFDENFKELSDSLDLESQMVLLDLAHVCAGRFAAKTSQPLRQSGIEVYYPYLEPPMVDLSLSIHWRLKSQAGKKWLLKRLLAENLPTEMVYRPKESFLPPLSELFLQTGLQAALYDVVLAGKNPIRDSFSHKVAQFLVSRTRAGLPLSLAAYNFLWTLAFATLWLQQILDSETLE